MVSLQELFKGRYKRCACGYCECLIPIFDKNGIPRNYKKNHIHKMGGRSKVRDYWYLYMPDYFSCNTNGTVREHVYFYQEKHKLCMLPWGVVHHIDGNTENNMPWNLEGMMKSRHMSIHFKGKRRDMSERKCIECGTIKTYYRKDIDAFIWYKSAENWLCLKCYYIRKKIKREICPELNTGQARLPLLSGLSR